MPRVLPLVPASPAASIQDKRCIKSCGPAIVSAHPSKRAIAYELRASAEQLPTINCTKGVKNVWLSREGLTRCNTFLYRYKQALAAAHFVGTLCGVGAMFAPASVGRICGVVAFALNLPGILVGLLVLRYDMIKVVLRTYEFWYLSTMNAMAMVLMTVLFSDARSLNVVSAMLGFQITILIDASYRAVQTTMVTSVVSGLALGAFMVVALLGLVSDAWNPPLFAYGAHSISVVDGIANCLSTVVLMLWRNALRKYLALDGASTAVRCITYRCRVRLCSIPVLATDGATGYNGVRKVLVRESSSRARLAAPLAQLQYLPSCEIFHASATLLQRVYKPSTHVLPWPARALLHATSVVGLVTTVLVFLPCGRVWPRALPVAAAASTLVFCGVYVCHLQRRLLRLLCLSFDFAFVSAQLSVAHVCLCDALGWRDARCLGVLASWLWVHWVLTIDALPPVLRARLGYARTLARIVLAVFVVAHVALLLELVVWNRLALTDRAVVAAAVGHHRVQVRTIPVLLGRMATTLCWSCRLLARLLRRAHDELIMIQGAVMFHDYQREARRTVSTCTSTAKAMAIVAVGGSRRIASR